MRRWIVCLLVAFWLCGCGETTAESSPEPAEAARPSPAPVSATEPTPPPVTPPGLAPAPSWAASTPSESGRPAVLLLGIDGAEWDVIDPLIAAGYLPNLARLVREGTRAALDCAPAMPETACFCPPVWLSIATGVGFDRHAISTIHHEATDRRAVAIWQLLHAAGGSSTLVSFRNTWPPEESARYVLTEYGLDWAGGELFERLPKEKPLLRVLLADQRFKPVDLLEDLGMLPDDTPKTRAWKMVARDRVAMEALLRLAPRDRTDLTAVLIHAPDKAQHLGWGSVQKTPDAPVDTAALLAQARAWKGPVEAVPGLPGTNVVSQYLETDAWLGRLLSSVSYDTILVASDHGMTRNPGQGLPGHHGIDSPEGHQGVLVLWGKGVRPGARLEDIDVFDVAPTLAHLLNLPVAEDLPGHVLLEAFTPEWRGAHPVASTRTWN